MNPLDCATLKNFATQTSVNVTTNELQKSCTFFAINLRFSEGFRQYLDNFQLTTAMFSKNYRLFFLYQHASTLNLSGSSKLEVIGAVGIHTIGVRGLSICTGSGGRSSSSIPTEIRCLTNASVRPGAIYISVVPRQHGRGVELTEQF